MSHTYPLILEIGTTGEIITVLESAQDTNGAYLKFEDRLNPNMTNPPPHIHREQTETFTVKQGRVRLIAGDQTLTLEPGQSYTVPAGMPHTFQLLGDEPLVMDVVFEPALDTELFFRGMAQASSTEKNSILQIALMNQTLKSRFYLAGIPFAVQDALFALLAIAARWLGYTTPRA
jgi:mannose-6-phosphate isomerase-like protein (cupin superfamily)